MIIDSHVHIGRLHNSPFATMTLEQVRNALLREMKRSGVDHALILPGQYKKIYSVDTPLDTILQLTNGNRFLHPMGSINIVQHTKKDVATLGYLLRSRRIVGIKLYPGYQNFYPYDTRCNPIYRLCEKFDVPVLFHSGDTLGIPGRSAKVKYSHPLHIDDVASDHPKLKIIMAHVGNPWLIDAAEVLYKNQNVYADISGLVVGETLSSPYGKLMRRRIDELIAYAGPKKLLFGTDWPLAPMKQYIAFAKSLNLSKKDQKYLFYKNAVELFKLNV